MKRKILILGILFTVLVGHSQHKLPVINDTSFTLGITSNEYYPSEDSTVFTGDLNLLGDLEIGGNTETTGSLEMGGTFLMEQSTITDNDATPDVSGANIWIYEGSANSVTITDLDNPIIESIYHIIGNSDTYTITINDGGYFNLSANITLGAYDVLVLYCETDNNYIEISRSDN